MSSTDDLNSTTLPQQGDLVEQAPAVGSGGRKRWRPLTSSDIQLYRLCDLLSGFLLMAMVVFSPWAFGTTQAWSIWTMTVASYVLGALLLVKVVIRQAKGYQPPRWFSPDETSSVRSAEKSTRGFLLKPRTLFRALAGVTISLLLFTLISALNARANYSAVEMNFRYHEFIKWLPHSLDAHRTWFHFWQYLGLAFAFWSAADWLVGKTIIEERVTSQKLALASETRVRTRHRSPQTSAEAGGVESSGNEHEEGKGPVRVRRRGEVLPGRLRTLLWVLAISGGLMALEGIIQRMEGSGRLLFIAKPRVNPGAETQFGPFAYRANGSQYLNLLWPVILGFWYTLHRNAARRSRKHHWLLGCTILMAASPIISTSRGGAIVTVALSFAGVVFLLVSELLLPSRTAGRKPGEGRSRRIGLFVFLACTLSIGWVLGWTTLSPRMSQIGEGFEGREEMYDRARPMAEDYPWYGTGPGTFETVFQLYRFSTETYWPAQLHNDWLETRITFGWVGSALLAAALVLVLLRWFAPGGIHGGRRLVVMTWMAMGGCLVHARWDLPFQIHSIVFLFLMLCAMLLVLSRRGSTRSI